MKKNISFYVMHICLCFTFLFLPYAFSSSGSIFNLPNLTNNPHDRIYFFIYFLLLLFFYFNYYILIPKIYFKEKQIRYVAILVLFLLFFLWISRVFDTPETNFLDFRSPKSFPSHKMHPLKPGEFNHPNDPLSHQKPHHGLNGLNHFGGPPTQYNHTILVYLIGVISSLFIAIKTRLQKVEEDKMKSELSFLKAQINPHFLFNTLNSIYSLAIKKDDKTADAVVQLSELMRYIITDANDDLIALEKEINYINNYVLLQKTRLGNTVTVNYSVDGSPIGKAITPLILISFIENAFKHGVNPNENSEICIRIDIVEDYLTLFVSNNKVQSIKSDNGIGLQNTIERLALLYPNNHVLSIDDNQKMYLVNLTIKVG
ncbi:sensor histidine kinase [Flavobacterium aquiphilum]|uniref:sensor histidine kinase n=1 Tax=Flavobacterium aquiphilum TaxID=3003261 RepID=UPI0024802E5D|nr:sensor histidine kinase [Flavobacterium aquiphilum]